VVQVHLDPPRSSGLGSAPAWSLTSAEIVVSVSLPSAWPVSLDAEVDAAGVFDQFADQELGLVTSKRFSAASKRSLA